MAQTSRAQRVPPRGRAEAEDLHEGRTRRRDANRHGVYILAFRSSTRKRGAAVDL